MTTNANQFCFSRATYSALLKTFAESGYRFSTFSEEADRQSKYTSEKWCLLRHDVDISMDFAVDMARIEHEYGARSTYFVMLRSPMYNLMSRHCAEVLTQLVDLGHEIGLHFDAGCPRRRSMTLEDDIRFEIDTLSGLVGKRVSAFSFHQPSEEAIRSRIEISGVINTYHPDHMRGYKYISDSNRVWREMNPFELVAQGFERAHILMHPIWWMCEENITFDCWDRAIARNFKSEQRQILNTEKAYGPERSVKVVASSSSMQQVGAGGGVE
jgi:hypothetical protein